MKWTASNFRDSLVPLTIINRALGLRAIECPRGPQRHSFSLIYVLILQSLIFIFVHTETKMVEQSKMYQLELLLYKMFTKLNMVVIFYSTFAGWYFTHLFNQFVDRVMRIDETLKALGIPINHQKTLYDFYKMLLGSLILLGSLLIFRTLWLNRRLVLTTLIFSLIMFCVMFLVDDVMTFDFCVCVRSIGTRFKVMNDLFASLVSIPIGPRSFNKNGSSHNLKKLNARLVLTVQPRSNHSELKRVIRILKQVHLELGRASTMLCNIFRIQMSLEMGLVTVFLTGIAYNMYVKFVLQSDFRMFLCELTGAFLWSLAYVIRVILANSSCEEAVREADRTTAIIHAFHGQDIDVDTRNEIYQFALQIALRPLKFSTFGFSLDYGFIRSCFSTVTTYGLIIIQMSSGWALYRSHQPAGVQNAAAVSRA